ncbi:DUF6541 family protein [Amycolatopsis sp. Hca4]|uniref:DUF6541 family protein n=1 Tax=Amycolatopsis sp. Hca4 TaxID=2742131 RepID=UPI00159251AA|nr:DUF6541 family protein [Amycolatopsis sp. Hca4]QKV80462.1 hypothetical protein HUT10_46795 [Amycolatopsis sp. Hca4]
MSWLDAAPAAVLCGALLILPGLPLTHLLGLRRLAMVALAPVVVVALVTVTAIVAAELGIRWSLPLVLLVFAGSAVVAGCVVLPLRRRLPQPAPGDGLPVVAAAAGGLVVALALGALTVRAAIGSPEELVKTDDSSFHYNAVTNILNSGVASTFRIDTLGVPGRVRGFYPAAWHDLGSLLAMLTGGSVPATANILSVTIALVVWPLGCVLLMRQLAGPDRQALALAGLLSVAFGAFPWELLGWGILWPNLLGLSLVPAGVAVVMSMAGLAREDVIGRGRAFLLAPVALTAIAIAHPNAVVSLAAITLPAIVVALARAAARRYRAGRRPQAALFAAPIVLAAPAYWLVVVRLGVFAGPMTADSPPFESPSQALGEVLTGATNHHGAGWVLAGLVIVGAVSCFRQRSRRWLVAGHALSGGLYVLAAGVPGASRRIFTGFWYTDSHRLAAMLPVTGVPLVVIGVLAVVSAARAGLAPDGVLRRLRLWPPAAAVVVVIALLLATGGLHHADHRDRVLAAYPKAAPLVTPDEYALFTRIGRRTEPGTIVAQMPYNGSPTVMALTRRQVLFPQLNLGRLTTDQVYLAQHLNQAASDPRVCEIVNRLQVRYLLTNDFARGNRWDGTAYPAPSAGFRQIDQGGSFRLYRVSPCDKAADSR